ncbi:MAG: tyrosine--tRNA ligase [Puniceicoccales bacterium]|nr:tyrosine--tRNA ligase [Puniceicoccales bacterium]
MEGEILARICSNAEVVIGKEGLAQKLSSGRRLRIKLGVDPTRPDLTLGHMVVFNKLLQFQRLGHTAIFLIGDFTTTIGDPSGRSEMRPILSAEEIKKNEETYLQQAFKILDPALTEVRHNGEWFGSMGAADLLALSREVTVAQFIDRDDFSKRYKGGQPISLVEFLYPLIQGYDSVMLEADVELGGSDQLFNMLVGRALQKKRSMEEQSVICMPLLLGLDGHRKMSKSLGNYVAFNDNPRDMFGKIMSIGDEIMWSYYRLLLGKGEEEIGQMAQLHPMEMKKSLARQLVALFHSEATAADACEEFERVFSRNEIPDSMEEIDLVQLHGKAEVALVDALAATGKFRGKNEIRRLISQGAVRMNGAPIHSADAILCSGSECIIQVGKRHYFRVK